MMRQIIGFVIVCILCSSCTSESSYDGVSDLDSMRAAAESGTKIYTLPAPLQVATALSMYDIKYENSLINDPQQANASFSSNYARALNLGLYTIDLGYATVYEQKQSSLHFMKLMASLMDDLGISSGVKPSMLQRFENNKQDQDSLYKIILENYAYAHDYFQQNGREEVGLFIMTGAFVEGLHLSLNHKGVGSKLPLNNLIAQQKLFLKNITELLQYHESAEVEKLLEKLTALSAVYDQVEVKVEKRGEREVLDSKVSKAHIEKLRQEVATLREYILAMK